MNKLLKDPYDCFYIPPELSAQKQEVEECHQALVDVLNQYEKERSFSRCMAKRSGALSMSGKEDSE